MTAHWPSYTGQDNTFWQHEWGKHGTCCSKTAGLEDQLSYFSAALKMRSQEGMLSALQKAGILPNGKGYTFSAMTSAIKTSIGAAPVMGCKTGNTLSEIGVCYSKTMEATECDPSVSSQSGDEVSDCDTTKPIMFASPTAPGPGPAPVAGTCKVEGCGKFLPGKPCQCDATCEQYDSCCPDYKTTCSGPSPPPGPPSPPVPPSAGKCVSGQHGPPCKADSDCTSFTGCIRCASSGFCTLTPK